MRFEKLSQQISHHDVAIGALGQRIGHVEKTLIDHGTILKTIENAVTTQSSKPAFDFHKTVSTVTTLSVLFSMVVGGIIWVTTSQFEPLIQNVNRNAERISKAEDDLVAIKEKTAWIGRVEAKAK